VASGFRKSATYEGQRVGTVVALCQRMRTKHKNGVSSKRSAKTVVRKTGSNLTTLRALPGRTKRFVKSNPVRVILGAVALGVAVAKLKSFI
jgi:hypothetical protein